MTKEVSAIIERLMEIRYDLFDHGVEWGAHDIDMLIEDIEAGRLIVDED